MYNVDLYCLDELLERKVVSSKQEALKQRREWLIEFLVGYGVVWDDISEEEHKAELSSLSDEELEELSEEARFNKELDCDVVISKIKS